MNRLILRVAFAALSCTAVASSFGESLADSASSAGSSASSAGSASLRGSSDSISNSSGSSKKNDRSAVDDGDYRVAAVEPVQGVPELLRLKMRAVETADGRDAPQPAASFDLDVPRKALGERPLAPGDVIRARNRPYGVEFARSEPREPFYLVVRDDWQRDLQTRVLAR